MMRIISLLMIYSVVALGVARAAPGDYIAARNIAAGEVLADGDLSVAAENAAAPVDFYGMQTKRTLYKGQPITLASLRAPVMVKRNAIVMMEFNRGVLQIRTEGRALEEGGTGDFVRVMNLNSRQTVTARVAGADYVQVGR